VKAAAEEGGFDRPDIHYSRTFGRLDDSAWREVAEELKHTLVRLERIVRASEVRAAESQAPPPQATIILMHFGGPTGGVPENAARLDVMRSTSSAAIRAARPGNNRPNPGGSAGLRHSPDKAHRSGKGTSQ
jgi:hypothetical protein